ncbi:hypothetical protein PCC9214_05162 [Planktothrix tepida]|uniref:PEP-CTERM protein-sorting domain-containing protein n=1 Tax=Planktothrix tepida PCC 9214 TaxID=671072 RepID=A0A1J1LK46_9CYAN|nr:PEP-CTERM sorting domain-containing protein [Planktothrix tepida]CAD5983419.1 hypothetical protein PCC9214_05162 [Planktothrix tepida]CUR32292.1 exported hypothetical protein [Planktothrix tepida PCC 9214]
MKFNTILPSFFMAASVAVATSLPAQALTFDFSGTDNGGTGSATMNFTGLGTQNVTVDLWNTSSTKLNDGTGDNAPAITGFGFNNKGLSDPAITAWTLKAYNSSGTLQTIGSSSDSTLPWSILYDEKTNGITLDYLAAALNNGENSPQIQGGIYNPDAISSSALSAGPNFFSKATLNLTFASDFTLDTAGMSPYVRMQAVGNGGSLKLDGTRQQDVPEPLTILGSAAALGFGSVLKKQANKNKNKAATKDTISV